jgi:hypothetical protein
VTGVFVSVNVFSVAPWMPPMSSTFWLFTNTQTSSSPLNVSVGSTALSYVNA